MKLKPNPTLIGSFVLGALAVISAAALVLGGHSPIGGRHRLVVYFTESVNGLERGSAVRVRGVHGGRVLSLNPVMDPVSGEAVVAVVCDMRKDALADDAGASVDLGDAATIERLVEQGLRARLEPNGLSGEYSVSLDFFDPKRYPLIRQPTWCAKLSKYPSVPSVRSVSGELIEDVGTVMRNLRRADFQAVTGQLGDGTLNQTLRQVGDAAVSLKNLTDYLERNPSAVISGKKGPEKR